MAFEVDLVERAIASAERVANGVISTSISWTALARASLKATAAMREAPSQTPLEGVLGALSATPESPSYLDNHLAALARISEKGLSPSEAQFTTWGGPDSGRLPYLAASGSGLRLLTPVGCG